MNWIDLAVTDGTAVITLQNEKRRNAINGALADELVAACDAIDADERIGVVIIQGSGGFFCSGGDRGELGEISADPMSPRSAEMTSRIYDAFLRFGRLTPPTIAAVRGGALGAGMNLALAADVRIVAADAVLSSGFMRLGVHPGGGHFGLLARAAGSEAAAALGLLAAQITGERAVEIGLAWEACADNDVEERARRLGAAAAADPELARKAKASYCAQIGPPAMSWPASVELERGPQTWSFARKGQAGWQSAPEPAPSGG